MLTLILIIAALVFGALAVFGVPSRVSWAGLGVVALATAALIGRYGV